MAEGYYLKNIRILLNKGFSDEELRHLCYDVPDFRPVYDELAQNTGMGIFNLPRQLKEVEL